MPFPTLAVKDKNIPPTTRKIPPTSGGGDTQLRKHALLNRIVRQAPPPPSAVSPVKKSTATTATVSSAKAAAAASNHVKTSRPPPPPPRLTQYPSKSLHLGLFEVGRPLGKGKFGRVYLVRHRESGYICALKVLDKEEIRRERAEVHVRREIEVHKNLRHPNVLGFCGWFHDARRVFLMLEYAAGGELFGILQREGPWFPEPRAAQYVAQVASALAYLHSKNVMHRDMKPENILVGLHGELKLADFGYSVHAPSNRRDTLCGTLDYLPPEMLRSGQSSYTNAVDQWTLGVLTYEFLVGVAPFEDSVAETKRRIVKRDMKPLPSRISSEAKNFVHSADLFLKLLHLNPSKRLSLQDVFKHPWIVKHCKPLK